MENQTDPRKNFAPRVLPWLLAVAALVVYLITLNHWVSFTSLQTVAFVSGWTWQPQVVNPLSFVVLYPFRWLPAAAIPMALNIFSALCAALTLGLLARSVAILPQDRTEAQRLREKSDFSFLTTGSAWLPPVLAAAVCGLQFTFWQGATNFSGETFDLLLFAFVIWSLLEYRLDERAGRLFLAAAVFGAGMANNWGMVGYFPLFIAAIIWTRRLSFFNLRFLGRMAMCGLAGMLLYLLLPLLAAISGEAPFTFWQTLKTNLTPQYEILRLFFFCLFHPQIYLLYLALLLVYLMPILVMSIRWKSTSDRSRLGLAVANFLFHVVYGFLLVVGLWMALGTPFSPQEEGFGLTFCYLSALSIGYFSGYFLLVFGRKPVSRSSRPRPSQFEFLNRPILAVVWVLAVLAMVGLIYKNAPQIRDVNGDTLQRYAALTEKNLPATGGFLLSDDPIRLFLIQAALTQDGRAKDFVPLDTGSLAYPAYHQFLHTKYPQRWPQVVNSGELTNGIATGRFLDVITDAEQTNGIGPFHLIALMTSLAKSNKLYYLHPSFGYYFETFYLEPHGLVYKLDRLPKETLLPPPLDKNLIAENETFWTRTAAPALAEIEHNFAPPNPPLSPGQGLLARLHVSPMTNWDAVVVGTFYSRGLDYWGVQLQHVGDLTNAAASFQAALALDPDNVVAKVNLNFNEQLRARKKPPVNLSQTTADPFRNWDEVMNVDGPFDEPSFCLRTGIIFANGGCINQAMANFNRVCQLEPDYWPSRFALAQTCLMNHLPDAALDAMRAPLDEPERFSLTETNSIQLHILEAVAYFQKTNDAEATRLLQNEISSHPTNDYLLLNAAQIYLARNSFTNALHIINHKLELTPDDPVWLFTKGYVSIQVKDYNTAISALTRVLAIETNNPQALYNRAVAYLDSGKLAEARADYQTLQKSYPDSFQVAYGLGEIAWRQHDTNDAILNYEKYLDIARTNTAEATNILQRLRELKK
ncbi:MAG TPA: tetratricopeptide repeat protein [Verrucomicrobiae bacterium]|nr:tetratricopeptide repeat protein [Verrucomicrobiae bacterium]